MEPAVLQKPTDIEPTDADLVRRVQAGDVGAFAPLVTRYQDRIYNAAWRICRRPEDAADITQEAFLKAFQAIGTFEGTSGFYTWLFRIAMNLALTHKKKSQLRFVASLDDEPRGTAASSIAESDVRSPESHADTDEMGRLAAAALDGIDEQHRAVIVLRDIEGFDYQQIAEVLEINLGTVKSRVHRARVALREALDQMIGHGGAKRDALP